MPLSRCNHGEILRPVVGNFRDNKQPWSVPDFARLWVPFWRPTRHRGLLQDRIAGGVIKSGANFLLSSFQSTEYS